jgi:uncharacterized protein
MIKTISDRIPSPGECEQLMAKYSMLPNIVAHSFQVMRVALAITDNLRNGIEVNRDLVIAAALLHDITKTQSLVTNERHDISGGELLRNLGFTNIAGIVEQHVVLPDFNPQGRLEEREIIYYADKRVNHDKIVSIEERKNYLIQRYGNTEKIRNLIQQNISLVHNIEIKIADSMKIGLNQAIAEIKTG